MAGDRHKPETRHAALCQNLQLILESGFRSCYSASSAAAPVRLSCKCKLNMHANEGESHQG